MWSGEVVEKSSVQTHSVYRLKSAHDTGEQAHQQAIAVIQSQQHDNDY